MSLSQAKNPVDGVIDVLDRTRQFEDLVVEEGEEKTIPENEIWFVSGEIIIEGDLTVNGRLANGDIFPADVPDTYRSDTVAPKGRENRSDDAIYVMSSIENSFERLGIEPGDPDTLLQTTADRQTEDATVMALVYSLDETRAKQTARGVTKLCKLFQSDNYTFTGFHSLEPESIIDNRGAKITRQTRHYIFAVEISTHRLG